MASIESLPRHPYNKGWSTNKVGKDLTLLLVHLQESLQYLVYPKTKREPILYGLARLTNGRKIGGGLCFKCQSGSFWNNNMCSGLPGSG